MSLTPQGRRLLEQRLADWHRLWSERMAGIPDHELEAAARAIGQVAGIYGALCPRGTSAESHHDA